MRATIPHLAAPQQGSEFYKWSFPGAPVQVHLYFKVVQGIRQCLTQASASAASVSTKGVLLGRIVAPGLPEITGFRPLYTGNTAELEETIAFFRNSGDNLLPVGYFRTQAGDRLSLSPEDLSLAETYFPDPNCVFLLIETSTAGAANAGFFFWDRGKMNGGFYDFCFLEFPFDLPLLATDGQSNAKTDPQPAPDSAPVEPLSPTADLSSGSITPPSQATSGSVESHPLVPNLTPLRPATPLPKLNSTLVELPGSEAQGNSNSTPKPPRFGRAIQLALTAVLLALAGLAGGIFLPQRLAWIAGMGKNTEPTPIALKVERQGTDLSVTWNHNSPPVSRAETGRLTIYDGGAREISLDKKHIRSGSVVYSPVTAQIRVQLDLQASDHTVTSESVMVVLNRPGTTDSLQPAEVQPRRPVPSAPRVADAAELPSSSRASTSVRATREFLPPPESAATQSQPPELSPPPPVTAINSTPTAVLPPALTLPHSQPPPASKTDDTGEQPQVSSPPSGQLSSIGTSDYVPPVPIRRTGPPRLTPAQRSFLSRTVLVEIKVFIDASGNVRKTETLTRANPVLVTAAQSAASLWTFHPARKAGQNVPSEMVLRFKFDPPK